VIGVAAKRPQHQFGVVRLSSTSRMRRLVIAGTPAPVPA
jgi:hypothetical protein